MMHKYNARLFLVSVSLISQLAFADELINNGDFERGQKAWLLHPHMQLTTDTEKSGNTSLLSQSIPAPDDGYIHIIKTTQCVNIGSSTKLNFSGDFLYLEKPTKDHAHRVNFVWYDEKDCIGGGQAGLYLQPKLIEGWQQLAQNNIKPALNSHSVSIELIQNRRVSARELTLIEKTYYWLENGFSDSSKMLSRGLWDNISLSPEHAE